MSEMECGDISLREEDSERDLLSDLGLLHQKNGQIDIGWEDPVFTEMWSGWPAAIRRALHAEYELKQLRDKIRRLL